MRFNINLKVLISTVGSLFLFSLLSSGQTYSFVNYGTERNIPSGYVYTIMQSNDGFLWVGTANGLTRFDGFNFLRVQYPDSSVGSPDNVENPVRIRCPRDDDPRVPLPGQGNLPFDPFV